MLATIAICISGLLYSGFRSQPREFLCLAFSTHSNHSSSQLALFAVATDQFGVPQVSINADSVCKVSICLYVFVFIATGAETEDLEMRQIFSPIREGQTLDQKREQADVVRRRPVGITAESITAGSNKVRCPSFKLNSRAGKIQLAHGLSMPLFLPHNLAVADDARGKVLTGTCAGFVRLYCLSLPIRSRKCFQEVEPLMNHPVPIPYSTSVEVLPPDEIVDIRCVVEALKVLLQRNREKTGQFRSDVHVKTHGCAAAEFRVLPNLQGELAQGIFQHARTFSVMVRFSNSSNQPQPDLIPDGRGLAIKVFEVDAGLRPK
jgi:hypothetical protein